MNRDWEDQFILDSRHFWVSFPLDEEKCSTIKDLFLFIRAIKNRMQLSAVKKQ